MGAIEQIHDELAAIEAQIQANGATPELLRQKARLHEWLEGWRRALGVHVHAVTEPLWEGDDGE